MQFRKVKIVRGDRLREIRIACGLTQEELAEKLSLGAQQIWRYESGTTKPSSEIVGRIASTLSVNADYLLGISDDPIPKYALDGITDQERRLIALLRRGQKLEAIKLIVAG
jgi:transcriptional regulator with XRE-family HTH domain